MADPVIQPIDLLQGAPQSIIAGDKFTFMVNYYQDDGTGEVDTSVTPTFNSGTCSIRNLDDPDTEIDDPTVTITPIANGATISFPVDTSVSATYPIGRYVAKLSYVWEDTPDEDLLSDLLYFNVVGVTNPFK